jgi:hypothetical protein
MEIKKAYEQIGPHRYIVDFTDGTKREIRIAWVKTNAILKIILGFGSEIKDALLALLDGNIRAAAELAVNALSQKVVTTFFDQADEIARIALDEYDDQGKLVKAGDTTLMEPEDVLQVIQVVITDIVALLKNVLRPDQNQNSAQ